MTEDAMLGANSQELLRSYARRLGNLTDDKEQIAADIKELMKEAKDAGFDTKVLREAVKRERRDEAERLEAENFEALVGTYLHAIQGELFDGGDVRMSMQVGDNEPIEFTSRQLKRAADRARV